MSTETITSILEWCGNDRDTFTRLLLACDIVNYQSFCHLKEYSFVLSCAEYFYSINESQAKLSPGKLVEL